MKKKISLNESGLRKIIRESILLAEAKTIIEESMIAPGGIEKVWKYNDSGEGAYIVKGTDGRYYDVYPSYNDSYLKDSDCDEYINSICKKIEQSFANHGIPGHAYLYNWGGEGEVIVEIRDGISDNKFTEKFAEMLKSWLESKGFHFKQYDDMYNAYHFIYDNYSTEISDEKMAEELKDYTDVTDTVEKNARYLGLNNAMQIFKKLDMLMNMDEEPLG